MATTPTLDFVLFYVSDLADALAYFTDRLGFSRVPEQDAPDFYYLTGGSGPDFGISQARPGTPAAGGVEVYFKTGDLGGLHAALSARGAAPGPIEQRPFAAIFTLHTPDGQPITVMG